MGYVDVILKRTVDKAIIQKTLAFFFLTNNDLVLKKKFQGKSMVFIRSNQRSKEMFVFKVLISNLIMLYNCTAIVLLFQVTLFWGK